MSSHATIEHGNSRFGATLRSRRIRLVLGIVAIEGALVLFDAIPWWSVLVIAAAAFAVYIGSARHSRHLVVREASWIAAVSQLVVVLVPALALVVTTLVVILIVVVALVALALLVLDRR
ncbi:MAG TPA: hypothetical protein VNI55_06895 [Gaiellaceae bacterium]|nr:hypothetical protein [Gaiellaceae bacterium]